ncbi:rhodanese-like domain-containing protein [Vagococcus acidifermentans]|uniref:Rhodanese domain-containing protein n=1 Tax=Vagococcus acidifermentans TaxID=564710 RepID=A0A430B0Z3_9ENTE|nr:rhodanese-like domain-containing protein [Vagococcus acidifermentans]RSU13921.1 hypothetical protein CBF27_03195 [Vagococcus acidifermentans]
MYQSISPDEFEQIEKRNDIHIIDVREADEFAAGHIPQAQSLPLSELVARYSDTLDKELPYYLICLSGSRSAQAAAFLGNEGYQVTNVMGGMFSWRGEIEVG